MNADNNHTELFERYLQHRLDDRETKEFEVRLKIDPDFAKSFKLHKEIDMALLEEEIMFFRAELERIHEESKDLQWEAPMMLSREEANELDEAIMDQDVMSLREKLGEIHSEMERELSDEIIPKYSGIERAVADQNSILLHDELERFESNSQFVEELTDDEVLDEEIDHAIAQTDVMELRSKLSKIASELMPETKVVPIMTMVKRGVSIAAMIVALVSSGLVINNLASDDRFVDHQFEEAIKDITGPGPARGGSEDVTSVEEAINNGFEQFSAGNYETSLDFYDIAEKAGEGRSETWIKQGEANYHLERYEKAVDYFNRIIELDKTALVEEAEIFLMHSLWKLDRKDEVKERLEAILSQDDDHDFKEKSKIILDKLK